MDLSVAVYTLTKGFPTEERFGLTNQLRRSATSVAANIAEGHARSTRRDYAHFLAIAHGSLAETRTYLDLAERLGFASPADLRSLQDLAEEISKMLSALRARLRAEPDP